MKRNKVVFYVHEWTMAGTARSHLRILEALDRDRFEPFARHGFRRVFGDRRAARAHGRGGGVRTCAEAKLRKAAALLTGHALAVRRGSITSGHDRVRQKPPRLPPPPPGAGGRGSGREGSEEVLASMPRRRRWVG